jgi:DNA-binding transcriptional MerR regulator
VKTGEAAMAMGIDVGTVRNWIDNQHLSAFFSDGAKGVAGNPHRVLNESDVLVLNTIRHLRATAMTEWGDIAQKLESGFRVQEFPQNAISTDLRTIPIPQAEQAAKYLATVAERDAALAKVGELEEYVNQLRQQIAQKETDIRELQEQRLRDQRELQEQRMKDQRDIGRLQMQVEMLQKQIDELRNKRNE